MKQAGFPYAVEVGFNFIQCLSVLQQPISNLLSFTYRTSLICFLLLFLLRTNCSLAEFVSPDQATVIQQTHWWPFVYLGGIWINTCACLHGHTQTCTHKTTMCFIAWHCWNCIWLLLIVIICLPTHSTVMEVILPTICKVSITLNCLTNTHTHVHAEIVHKKRKTVANTAGEEKTCDCSCYECGCGNMCMWLSIYYRCMMDGL